MFMNKASLSAQIKTAILKHLSLLYKAQLITDSHSAESSQALANLYFYIETNNKS